MFQERLKGDSRKIEGCFFGVLSGVQRCLQEVQWVFEESYKVSLSNRRLKVFQVSFKAVSKTLGI